jgi:hypothetical protein
LLTIDYHLLFNGSQELKHLYLSFSLGGEMFG